MTLVELSQRLRRVDFLHGLGIYVGPHEVSLAHVSKRFLNVVLHEARTLPLPPYERAAERRQALTEAVANFTGELHVDAGRTYLCLPRGEAALNRVVLPAAARENLDQVLEYEIEHLVPLPRDQVFFDYSVRALGEDRIEVLLMCIPRTVVQGYLDALEDAGVRPRGIALASTAIGDYLTFCRGESRAPVGLLLASNGAVEFALLSEGQLLASQWLPNRSIAAPADLSRALARELSEELVSPEDVQLFQWQLANGAGPALPMLGEGNLVALAEGRLAAPPEFFAGGEPALLPAVGAALEAVREGSLPVNLLPPERRGRADEAMSLWTIGLLVASVALLVVWGVSALVKDQLLVHQVRNQIAAMEPQVQEVKQLQNEIDGMRKQVDILSPGAAPQVTVLLKELSEVIAPDAYLTSLNLRGETLTVEGQATSASTIITALEKSKHFKNVSFTSPTTRVADKERFSLRAEIER